MKATEIEIEFINTDYNPPLKQRCKLADITPSLPIIIGNNADVTIVPKWIDQKTQMPKHNDRVLFIVKGEVRLGVFLQYDQWNRENMFCDGAFHFTDKVEGWMMCPSASAQVCV